MLAETLQAGTRIRVDAPNGISDTGVYIRSAGNYLVWKADGLPGLAWQDLTFASVTKLDREKLSHAYIPKGDLGTMHQVESTSQQLRQPSPPIPQ